MAEEWEDRVADVDAKSRETNALMRDIQIDFIDGTHMTQMGALGEEVQGIVHGAKDGRSLCLWRPATQIVLSCKAAAAHGVRESHCSAATSSSTTVASVSDCSSDFRKAAAELTANVPPGVGKHDTNEHEARKVRDASIAAFDADVVQVKLALSRAAGGLKSSTTEANDSIVDFKSATEMVENVLDRLPCEHDDRRSKVMAAHTRGHVTKVPETATACAFDTVVDSGAAGSIFPHLPNKNEKDPLICEAMNKSTSTTTGSGAIAFKVKDVNGHLGSIQLRRAHELKESSMAIISLFDLRQEGCQFHMDDDDMWIQDFQGHRIPSRFKDKVVCLRLVPGLSPAKWGGGKAAGRAAGAIPGTMAALEISVLHRTRVETHCVFGHLINGKKLEMLPEHVAGLKTDPDSPSVDCVACALSKIRRKRDGDGRRKMCEQMHVVNISSSTSNSVPVSCILPLVWGPKRHE